MGIGYQVKGIEDLLHISDAVIASKVDIVVTLLSSWAERREWKSCKLFEWQAKMKCWKKEETDVLLVGREEGEVGRSWVVHNRVDEL